MDWKQRFDGLHLHHNQSSDKEVQTITASQKDSFVINMQWFLPLEWDFPQGELVGETLVVSGFQQSRPKRAVDLDGGADKGLRQIIDWGCWNPLTTSVSPTSSP